MTSIPLPCLNAPVLKFTVIFFLFFLGVCWTLIQIKPLEVCLDLSPKYPEGPSCIVFFFLSPFFFSSLLFFSFFFTPFSENFHDPQQHCPYLKESIEGRGCLSISICKTMLSFIIRGLHYFLTPVSCSFKPYLPQFYFIHCILLSNWTLCYHSLISSFSKYFWVSAMSQAQFLAPKIHQ